MQPPLAVHGPGLCAGFTPAQILLGDFAKGFDEIDQQLLQWQVEAFSHG